MSPEATLIQAEPLAAPLGLHPGFCSSAGCISPTTPRIRCSSRGTSWPAKAIARGSGVITGICLPIPNPKPFRPALADPEGLLAVPNRARQSLRCRHGQRTGPPGRKGPGSGERRVRRTVGHGRGRGDKGRDGDADSHPGQPSQSRRSWFRARVPAVMRGPSGEPAWKPDRSGRLELAQWLADADHPLTSRSS